MRNFSGLFYFLFAITVVADILFIYSGQQSFRFITKPLLIPVLMIAYYQDVKALGTFPVIFLWGLFFSWLGDVLLMLESFNDQFFIAGLLGFLTAHVMYIRYFLKIRSERISFFKIRPIMLLPVFAYTFELLYILWPSLYGMKIPVTIYAVIISLMLCCALWQYKKLDDRTAFLLIFGALLFVISDSLLAYNKFRSPVKYAGEIIMLTYCLAQFFLAKGSAVHLRRQNKPALS